MQLKKISYTLGLAATVMLSACGSLGSVSSGSKIDYKSQTKWLQKINKNSVTFL